MGIVVPNAYALTLAAAGDSNRPVIGWHNLVRVDTIGADHEVVQYPATNLANPDTNLVWKSGSTADQYVTVLFGAEVEVDYIAVARHNLGTGLVAATVHGLPFGGNPATDGDWDELVAQNLLADDSPAIWRFEPSDLIGVRLKLEPGSVAPQAAVLHCGKLLVMEKGVQPGHVPFPFAAQPNVISPIAVSGDFLGDIIVGGKRSSTASFINLTPAWVRGNLGAFLRVARLPFFWAWRPTQYPAEVGYAKCTNNPMPVPSQLAGFMDLQLQMDGLIL